ncbi:MAG: GAF domain-containing protein [Acidobacteriota bacterium]
MTAPLPSTERAPDIASTEPRADIPAARRDLIDGAVMLLAGFDSAHLDERVRDACRRAGLPSVELETAATLDDAEIIVESFALGTLALGPRLDPTASLDFVVDLFKHHPFQKPIILFFGTPAPDDLRLQMLIQEDRLFYTSPEGLDAADTATIVAAGQAAFRARLLLDLAAARRSQDRRVLVKRRLLATAEPLLRATRLEELGEPVFDALHEMIGIDRGRLWSYDPIRHTLTAIDSSDSTSGIEVSAAAGLTSFAARSGTALRVDDSALDPRHDHEVDGDPGRLLAVPIHGPDRQTLGMLTVGRSLESDAFSALDVDIATSFADYLRPLFAVLGPRPHEPVLQAHSVGASSDLFRDEAIEASARGFSERGRVLRNTQDWTRWTWLVLLAGVVLTMLFLITGRMHDYASGQAVVQIGQRVEVTTHIAAAVTAVEVEPWQQVTVGTPLIRLYGAPEATDIANLESDLEQRLRQRLIDPTDKAVEAALIDVRTRLEQARARLAERVIRAPIDGAVGDLRIRPGQHLAMGEPVLSLIADQDERSVVALVPGEFGPQLRSGQPARLSLQGYPDFFFHLEVTTVGEEVISLDQARQALGRPIIARGTAPVVLVRARLPEATFDDGGRPWPFRDGMQGVLEIRVRSQPILFHLVPGLERVFGDRHG